MKELTARQDQILQFMKSFVAAKGFPPTIREISGHFGVTDRASFDHLRALERKGRIRIGANQSRAVEIIGWNSHSEAAPATDTVRIPVLGTVAAGRPVFSFENYEGSLDVPRSMVRGTNHFALRVRGDSMCGAGILDGDLAIVERAETARNGEIVVAMVEDAVTLKRFFLEPNRVRLQAENPAYPPIYSQDVRVIGRLTQLMRTY